MTPHVVRLGGFIALVAAAATARTAGPAMPDLPEYRTAETAEAAKMAPAAPDGTRGAGYLGLNVARDGAALVVREVAPGSPAASAGVRPGDILRRADGVALDAPEALRERIQSKASGEKLTLSLARDGKPVELSATLAATSRPVTPKAGGGGGKGKKGGGGFGFGAPVLWKQPVYRLGVVVIEYPDAKANKKITKEWADALFGTGTHKTGSLNDYYREQSQGAFRVEGKVFAPVMVSKKRAEYVEGSGTSNKSALPSEALAKLAARDGKDAIDGVDGLCFIYAGANRGGNRGSLYYPHQSSLNFQGKRRDYILCPEGGAAMEPIGTFAVEFAKLLGLPSLAARTENAGSEGLGKWCLMSDGGQGARPTHLSAWCKERMGWLKPTVLDPTKKQKLVLGPVQSSPRECFKILVRLDGSEYFLLENRTAKGFDAALPGHGLLIWRVVGGRPTLEESHGVEGPRGPLVHLDAVPFPSRANRSFTPATTPSSRPPNGGGLPVHLTNIRRLPDGRITLHVGYEYD